MKKKKILDSFILCSISFVSLTNFHIIFIFFNSLFIWHIIFIIIFISYLFAKLIKCQPFLKSGVQVFDLLPKHVCMQHKFLHGKRCVVDQVQEAHPIFTCQICVEPMLSNQKFNYNDNHVHPFLWCQIRRSLDWQQGAKHCVLVFMMHELHV